MKSPGVADQIPIARETHNPLHITKIQLVSGEHHIGRIRTVAHRMLLGMTVDGCAAQPLQDTDLDFVRPQRVQSVEAAAKGLEILSRQSGNQVDMYQRGRSPSPDEHSRGRDRFRTERGPDGGHSGPPHGVDAFGRCVRGVVLVWGSRPGVLGR